MNFYKNDDYTIEDIEGLINNEVEENIHLDYKASAALEKNDRKRAEITKDVSAFANSDGGIIIYGISEEDHRPKELSFIDGRIYTKEWLENVIQLIQPRIEGIRIFPIRGDDMGQTLYVVKIPRSGNAPHMANDRRYYKRYNFMSVPMEDYEVKDLFYRMATPDLDIVGCSFYQIGESDNDITYNLKASVVNYGHTVCDSFKLNFYINTPNFCSVSCDRAEKHSFTQLDKYRLKLSTPSQEPLYPDEELAMGNFHVVVKKENLSIFKETIVIDMILFYPGGHKDLAFVPQTKEFIAERDEIEKLLEQRQH